MKKGFSAYVAVWGIAFVVFSVICFIAQAELLGSHSFESSFWIGYGFIVVSFVGLLVCAHLAFKSTAEHKELVSMFYKYPLISLSYWGVVAMAIVGSVVMAVPKIPNWIGVILCLIILAIAAIEIIKAYTAANYVSAIDDKITVSTSFIRMMTVKAEGIADRAKNDTVKTACEKIAEAIRYSDPVSHQGMLDTETRISLAFDQFSLAVDGSDDSKVLEAADELTSLLNERNRLCKLMK